MKTDRYLPEGKRLGRKDNIDYISSSDGLRRAMLADAILEAPAVRCDSEKNLIVELGEAVGIIPYHETALGIEEGKLREIAIISRVGKPVCFKIKGIEGGKVILSRRDAQVEAVKWFMENLVPGDVIGAKVTHLEPFGAFVDIGCGVASLIGIENISVSRISHPSDRFRVGQYIPAVVLSVDKELERVTLTHRELLGTWEENASMFHVGETVTGIVRGVEEYGVFVELAPNLSGLAEKRDDLTEGNGVSVYIKSITPERMKIIIDSFEQKIRGEMKYFIKEGRISHWQYSPKSCTKKVIEHIF